MADTPYPHYYMQANGPNETGVALTIQVEDGAGGPLAGLDDTSLMNYLRDYLAAQDATTVSLAYLDIAQTNL